MSGDHEDAAAYDALLAGETVSSSAAEPVVSEPIAAPEPAHEPAPEPAAIEQEPVSEAPAHAPVEPQQTAQESHRVPLAELLAERDKRHALERQQDALRAQYEQTQRELQGLKAPKPTVAPDIFDDPNAWAEHTVGRALSPVEQRMVQMERQTELLGKKFAVMQHGQEKVDAAQRELIELAQSGDQRARMDYQAIMSASPAERYSELMDWHARREVFTKTGGDLGKYEQSLQDRLLADPAFLARALEAAQKQAASRQPVVVTTPTQAAKPRTTSLPSVSQMGAAAPIGNSGSYNVSDADLYDQLLSK
jgi:hypothetical protein